MSIGLSFSKRLISGISAVVLSVTALAGVLHSDIFQSNDIEVSAFGVTTGSGGSLPAGSNGQWNFTLPDGGGYTSGVRMYLVKTGICKVEEKSNPDGLSENTLWYLNQKNLSNGYSKDYALYAFPSSKYMTAVSSGGSAYAVALSNGNDPKRLEISRNQFMPVNTDGTCSFGGSAWGFDGNVTSFSFWRTGSSTYKFTSLSDWCNANLGTAKDGTDNFTADNLDTFLKSYRNKIGTDIYDSSGLPSTVSEYVAEGWTIVVEPVLMVKASFESAYYAFSYQDIHGYGYDNNVYQSYYSSSTNTTRYFSSSSVLGLYYKTDLNGLFLDFNTTIASVIDKSIDFYSVYSDDISSFKADATDNTYIRGIGVFGVNGSIYGSSNVKVNKHYEVYADESAGSYSLSTGEKYKNGYTSVAMKSNDEFELSNGDVSTLTGSSWFNTIKNIGFFPSASGNLNLNNGSYATKDAVKPSSADAALKKLVGNTGVSSGYLLKKTSSFNVSFTGQINLSILSNLSFNPSLVSVVVDPTSVGSSGSSYYNRSVGNSFTTSLEGVGANSVFNDQSALALSALSEIVNAAGGLNLRSKTYDNVDLSSNINMSNIWGNTNTDSIVNANAVSNKNENKIGNGNTRSSFGLTMDYFIEDVKVNSSRVTLRRESDGTYASSSIKTSDPYSVYRASGWKAISNELLGSTGVSYIVSFPNTSVNADYAISSQSGVSNMMNLLFNNEIGDLYYGTYNGLKTLATLTSNLEGVSIIPVGNEKAFDLTVGAYREEGVGFKGYSVYIVEDAMTRSNQDTEMTLEAYELNYVYPTLLGISEGHIVKTVSDSDLGVYDELNNFSITKTDNYSGSAISHESIFTSQYDLLYSTFLIDGIAQRFAPESEYSKFFSSPGETGVWLNHQVNLSRGTFGDRMTLSAFNAENFNTINEEYAVETLGLSIDAKTSNDLSEDNAGNVVQSGSGSDIFTWSCDKYLTIASIYGNNIIGRYGVSPYKNGESISNAGYTVKETAYKYITNVRGIGKGNAGVVNLDTASNYKAMFSTTYDDVLTFYPEVSMIAYVYNDKMDQIAASSSQYSLSAVGNRSSQANPTAVSQCKLSVLGDRARQINPTGVFSVRVISNPNPMLGVTKSDTVATGTDAKNLSQSLGNLQVVYAGGNVNMRAESAYEIDVSGFVLDQIDINVDSSDDNTLVSAMSPDDTYSSIIANNLDLKKIWSNSDYNAEEKYQAWVNSFKSNLAVDISMKTSQDLAGSHVVKVYNNFKASLSKATGGDIESVTSYALTYKNGAVVDDDAYKALIKSIAQEYYSDTSDDSLTKARALFEASGINKSILNSIESGTNADNGSGVVDVYGDSTNWYDEEVRTFVVRYYKCTPVQVGNIVVSDKIDINAGPSQNANNHELFQSGYVAKWYATVYLKSAVDNSMNGLTFYDPRNYSTLDAAYNDGTVLLREAWVNGADFIISDATTSDARN